MWVLPESLCLYIVVIGLDDTKEKYIKANVGE